jgi:DNA-binding transcriptional regulator YiaG
MGKMEQAIRSEINRLAAKQMKAVFVPIARNIRRLNRAISVMTKTVAAMSRLCAEIEAERAAERSKLAVAPEEVRSSRISPRLIKKLRERLGLSQGEMAKLVGVSTNSVGFWEQGKARPQGRNREALVALRKLGKREVAELLAAKVAEAAPKAPRRARGRRK